MNTAFHKHRVLHSKDDAIHPESTPISGIANLSVPVDDIRNFEFFKLIRGYAKGITDSKATINIKYSVKTAVLCPCENEACKEPIGVGRWAAPGRGSWKCVLASLRTISNIFLTMTTADKPHHSKVLVTCGTS